MSDYSEELLGTSLHSYPRKKYIFVTGGRDYKDRNRINEVMSGYIGSNEEHWSIVHGDAAGADALVDSWADHHGVQRFRVPANWKQYGKSAGPKRNQLMVDTFGKEAVVCIAFPTSTSIGTWDMVGKCKAASIPVKIIDSPLFTDEPRTK